ncbi:SDR family NAD(P)-dependent oxidoreductase [Flavobacterium sp. P21]|uniref:SDR family NAD(P)-dependent oxidoreductase n=1 Tax=Flavobacterium sp. P21 TaxID=3423948 RepID=UPI003D672D2E
MKTKAKIVWITGASSDIEKSTAKSLLKNGFVVYASAKRKEEILNLRQLGAHIMLMDISEDRDMQSGIDEIIANEGRIDILINSAGFGLLGAIEDVSIEEVKYEFDVNVFGLARLSQLVLPYMRKQKSGKIITISSDYNDAEIGLSGWYSASKYAIEAINKSIRKEVEPFGVDVVLLEPHGIKSEWSRIAAQSLQKISTGKAYAKLAEEFLLFLKKSFPKNDEPSIVAELILKSILEAKPKGRYYARNKARAIIEKVALPDKQFDKSRLGQLA